MDGPETLGQHILALETRLLQPEVRRSSARLCELLADGFIEFGSSGRVFDREAIIAELEAEEEFEARIFDFRTVPLGAGIVLALYRAVLSGGGSDAPSNSLRSSIWRQIDGSWQMVFHQGTPL